MTNRFLIRIDGVAQGKDHYQIIRDDDGTYGRLTYALPNLYNGDESTLHQIEVTHLTGGGVTLEASRFVRARQVDTGPHIDIVQPLEFDSDGKPLEIYFPASSLPQDRVYTIRVETDLDAKHVWLKFTNSVGYTVAFQSTTNPLRTPVSIASGSTVLLGESVPLSGLVSVIFSNNAVTGAGTSFSNEVMPGTGLRIDSNAVVVSELLTDTNLLLTSNYPGATATGVMAWVQADFESELSVGGSIIVDGHILGIQAIGSSTNLTISEPYPGTTTNNAVAYRLDGNPQYAGGRLYWNFRWTNILEGFYTYYACVNTNSADTSQAHGQHLRHTTVVLREMATNDVSDLDDDDDGLYDADEVTPVDLPESNAETWTSGDVHVWQIYGRTENLLPDTDEDDLPDGLESGWRVPISLVHTDTSTDSDGDGYPNFRADLDPPFYNSVPDNNGLPDYVFNDSRTRLIHGSLTDPNNPDSDYDGLRDGVEDRNRNGWADGDGLLLQPGTVNPWDDRPSEASWPNGEWDNAWATHPDRETDPNKADTDEDGASDGYGEDINFSGWIDGDANSNRIYDVGEVWTETDPLNPDTDGDGLPDGWEKRYGLNALDSGVIGATNLGTGLIISNLTHGASGNPDQDVFVSGGVTNPYSNLLEFQNGTNPTRSNALDNVDAAPITVGRGESLGTLGSFEVYEEFMDWTLADCIVLDEYEGDGPNNQQGDLYLGWDGWDTSRDIVAFYAHDGGDSDGHFYFRLDFQDLQAHAEDGQLDFYVVIDTGNPGAGEMTLPDDVDTITWNRWEAVVAVYGPNSGRVYIDLNPGLNSTDFGQNLFAYGVVARDQSTPDGFVEAHFNAELDTVEFSISRKALIDAGWSGFGASNFNYQVFTTKDGTGNNPVGGGDIGGRSDVRDAIFNDFVAEDYWQSQQGLENILKFWIPGTRRCGQAKVAFVIHGNQAIEPASDIQRLINNGSGAGYHRALDAHTILAQPLNLHVTPTLASAIEWASVDPAAGKPWRDGPAFNDRIAELIATNVVVLLGSTFSDHMLPYFTKPFNRDNEQLARQTLETIYDTVIDPNRAVFWAPERLLDTDVFEKILDMGYSRTLLDQDTHLWNWFGRTESLIDGAYQMNEIDGVKAFVINKIPSESMFVNHDSGVDLSLRSLLSRKARNGTQDQVTTLFSNWEVFGENAKADAYDRNLWWLANRPWVRIVSLEAIANGEVHYLGHDNSDQFNWGWRARGSVAAKSKQSHNWLNHATAENYDNWYLGSGIEEGLLNRIFEIRPGTNVLDRYGMMYSSGHILDSWTAVDGVGNSNLAWLARATLHASTFQTAFHEENENDLRRYSIGTYMVPAVSSNALKPFAAEAQSQSRRAALYGRVDQWAASAGALVATQRLAEDVDLDGEDEYLLYNRRLFAVFERSGGRCIGVWVRDILDGQIAQAAGNFISHPGSLTEQEGDYSIMTDSNVVAHRTSLFKDWWVDFGGGGGTLQYVNDVYTFTPVSDGWQAVSSDLNLSKTITLADDGASLEASYALSGALDGKTLYVRHGLSPNLEDLLLYGQSRLSDGVDSGTNYTLVATNFEKTVAVIVDYGSGTHDALLKADATDDDPANGILVDARNMRNQAQTEQVEIYGTDAFSFALRFQQLGTDWDMDGIPNTVEDAYPAFLNATNPADGTNDFDMDGMNNADEFTAGTAMDSDADVLRMTYATSSPTGFVVRFPAKPLRQYRVWYQDSELIQPSWSNATPLPLSVTSESVKEWTDDGSTTDPHPTATTQRFYHVDVTLPL
ncbi:MAG: hypothetical protein O3A51_02055 [Verrucomicrobia bacterium]|nr:hypothetical protein [Verrucomicrobiota bacterium]